MRRSALILFALLCTTTLCTAESLYSDATITLNKALNSLEHTINNKIKYTSDKEISIQTLKNQLQKTTETTSKCDLYASIIDEYRGFNTDSQMVYSRKRHILSKTLNNVFHRQASDMNYAEALIVAGMYTEAISFIDKNLKEEEVLPELKSYYFYINHTLYDLMADYSIVPDIQSHYRMISQMHRDSLLQVNDTASFIYKINIVDILVEQGNTEKAREILSTIDKTNQSNHNLAILNYCIAKTCTQNERTQKEYYLATSATYDISTANREYISLRELATMLYEDGDIERSYIFMRTSMEDAVLCNARMRSYQVLDMFPIIDNAYKQEKADIQRKLITALTALAIGFIILIIVIICLVILSKKLYASRETLNDANNKLQEINKELNESTQVKEEYLALYMGLCANYIDIIEHFNHKMQTISRTGDMKALQNAIDKFSPDKEWENFYKQFDNSFLKLFPDFVDKFNNLLKDGEQIQPKSNGQLSTELRVYALIRLGVTDSAKIAKFLHYSIVTIYNVRVKIRNKAKTDRENFDHSVMAL